MSFELLAGAVTMSLAILGHGAASIWWAAKITTQVANISASLIRFEKELEKRDNQIAALWQKVDSIQNRMLTPK